MSARDLLRPLLATLRTPASRRAFAADLRQLADEQERLAAADERIGHVARREQIRVEASRQRTGRPRGSGARFVRWEPSGRTRSGTRRSGHLHIGRALWQELGEPQRIDIERHGKALALRPCEEGRGWAVCKTTQGMPRLNIGDDNAESLELEEGRHAGRIEGGAIVVG